MYYKVNDLEGRLLFLTETLRYAKKVGSKFMMTYNCVDACGLFDNNNEEIYDVENALERNDSYGFPKAIVTAISESAYNRLKVDNEDLAPSNTYMPARTVYDNIEDARNAVIANFKTICHNKIVSGFKVKHDNAWHKVTLSIEDQINLNNIKFSMLSNTAETMIPYHFSGENVGMFTYTVMDVICNLANLVINYNTSYFNIIKDYIRNCNDETVITGLKYGDFPEDLMLPEWFGQLYRSYTENISEA